MIGKFARGRRIEARPYCEHYIKEIKNFNGCSKYKKKRGSIKVSVIENTSIFYLGDKIEICYRTHGVQVRLTTVFENYQVLNTGILNTDNSMFIDYKDIYKIKRI